MTIQIRTKEAEDWEEVEVSCSRKELVRELESLSNNPDLETQGVLNLPDEILLVHAVRLPDGTEWDVVNGFRDEEKEKYDEFYEEENLDAERNNDWQEAGQVNEQYRRTDNLLHEIMRQMGFQPEHWHMQISRTLFKGLKVMAEAEQQEMEKYKPEDQIGHYDLEEQLERSDRVSIVPDTMLPSLDTVILTHRHDGNSQAFQHEVFTELVEAITE